MRYYILLLPFLTSCISREEFAEGASHVGSSVVTGFMSGGPIGAIIGGVGALGGLAFGGRKAYVACVRKRALKHVIQAVRDMIKRKEPISTDMIRELLAHHLDHVDSKIVAQCKREIEEADGILV